LVFSDEQTQKAEVIAERIAAGEVAVVTSFWAHEVLNSPLVGERKKRITADQTKAFLEGLQGMAVVTDTTAPAAVFNAIQWLCRTHGLTSYDAAYLKIAMRGKYQLATVDNALMNAARAEGVGLF
jgi:predicted nucleic acid-binding protein